MRNNQRRRNMIRIKDQKKFIKTIRILGIIILYFILALVVRNFLPKPTVETSTAEVTTVPDNTLATENITPKTDANITFGFIGDIMCHNTQYMDAYNSSSKKYDFSYVFKQVKYHLQTPDVTIGNLETTFTGKDRGYSSYPTFNTPEALAGNLKEVGIDILSTANNHSLDKGYEGIKSTINYLDKADIAHMGTYTSKDSQNKIFFKYIKGVKCAFLSYTYGTNGFSIPPDKPYCINKLDKKLIKKHLKKAKEEGAEIICANVHWGQEYQTSPNKEQKDMADFLFKNGVDVIIGSHPHVLQKMEKRTVTLDDGTKKDGFVIYSLGNFMSGQVQEGTRNSIILNLEVTKNAETGKITIDHAEYVPIYMHKDNNSKNNKYKILDIEKSIENYESGKDTSIGKSTYNLLKKELKNIKQSVGKEF